GDHAPVRSNAPAPALRAGPPRSMRRCPPLPWSLRYLGCGLNVANSVSKQSARLRGTPNDSADQLSSRLLNERTGPTSTVRLRESAPPMAGAWSRSAARERDEFWSRSAEGIGAPLGRDVHGPLADPPEPSRGR